MSVGGGTSGLAVFSLLALLFALALIALLSLKPWESDSVAPAVGVSPELGVGLGDAVAVAAQPGVRIARAHVAPPGRPVLVDSRAKPVAAEDPAPVVGVSAARPVQVSAHVPTPLQPQPQPQQRPPATPPLAPAPVAVPPAPEPAPVMTPVASPTLVPGDERPFPQSVIDREAGDGYVLKLQAEEGGEYAFALAFQVLETIFGEPGADSMVMVIGDDQLVVPLAIGTTHEAVVHLKAASDETGFYAAFFDGAPLAVASDVSLIEPEGGEVRIELFFLRAGEPVDTSEILFDAARLGSTLESVLP